MNGINADGGNWSQSCLKNGLEKKTLKFPDPTPIPDRNYPLPYMCMGDDAFPITAYIMKPYSLKNLWKEVHIHLPTFMNDMHIRKRIWHPH